MTRDEIITEAFTRLTISTGATARVSRARSRLNRIYVRVVRDQELSLETEYLVFTADDPFVDLPDSWLSIKTIRVGSSVIVPRVIESITANEAASVTTAGSYVLYPPNRIRLGWTPTEDDNEAAVIHYVKRPTLLAAAGDIPSDIPDEFHDVLVEELVLAEAQVDEEQEIAAEARANLAILYDEMRQALKGRAGQDTHRVHRTVYG